MAPKDISGRIFTTKEAAEYLGVKPETIKYHVHISGRLTGLLINARLRVYTQVELDTLADELNRTPNQPPPEIRKPGRPRKPPDEPG